jgi:hypothetical protein
VKSPNASTKQLEEPCQYVQDTSPVRDCLANPIPVKTRPRRPRLSVWRSLALQEVAGAGSSAGVVLSLGNELVPFGERPLAAPVTALWRG